MAETAVAMMETADSDDYCHHFDQPLALNGIVAPTPAQMLTHISRLVASCNLTLDYLKQPLQVPADDASTAIVRSALSARLTATCFEYTAMMDGVYRMIPVDKVPAHLEDALGRINQNAAILFERVGEALELIVDDWGEALERSTRKTNVQETEQTVALKGMIEHARMQNTARRICDARNRYQALLLATVANMVTVKSLLQNLEF